MSRYLALPVLTLILALPAAAQTTSPTPARDVLQAGAANPECTLSGITGDACPTTAVSAVSSSTGSAKSDASGAAIAHRKDADVPSPASKKKNDSFLGKAEHKIGKYFSDDGVKEGTAFGAAIGMLLLASTPVGIIGGALIGAAVGAIICGGLISKIWHHFHKDKG